MNLLSSLQSRVAKRAEYRRTVKALRQMPLDVALDLEIHPGDAEKIAKQAVYGR
ncbi:hypothetical protein [Puniceibacterium sediminis]|uniref:DUF1127 domain-containing protein n=1 Tax=Puniceibacterium sediminis TaxID=1608407 RepID=A0A238XEL4_9RHOB|nr:hypothetical protein [Puniceibacterium sediminis]SNR57465.1 hypothetical protein SAMN06265370_11110 [Puniceibacterium sediminis]